MPSRRRARFHGPGDANSQAQAVLEAAQVPQKRECWFRLRFVASFATAFILVGLPLMRLGELLALAQQEPRFLELEALGELCWAVGIVLFSSLPNELVLVDEQVWSYMSAKAGLFLVFVLNSALGAIKPPHLSAAGCVPALALLAGALATPVVAASFALDLAAKGLTMLLTEQPQPWLGIVASTLCLVGCTCMAAEWLAFHHRPAWFGRRAMKDSDSAAMYLAAFTWVLATAAVRILNTAASLPLTVQSWLQLGFACASLLSVAVPALLPRAPNLRFAALCGGRRASQLEQDGAYLVAVKQAWVAAGAMSSEASQKHGNSDTDLTAMSHRELLSLARQNLHGVDWPELSPAALAGRGSAKVWAVGQGEAVDAFLSYCPEDAEREDLWMVLSELASKFRDSHHRDPSFWVEQLCLLPQLRDAALWALPVHLLGCRKVVVLWSNAYPGRLLNVWHLFALTACVGEDEALRRIEVHPLDPTLRGNACVAGLRSFDYLQVRKLTAADSASAEEQVLQSAIENLGSSRFSKRVQALAGKLCWAELASSLNVSIRSLMSEASAHSLPTEDSSPKDADGSPDLATSSPSRTTKSEEVWSHAV